MKKVVIYVLLVLTLFTSFSFVTNIYAKENLVLNINDDEVGLGDEIIVSLEVDEDTPASYAYTASLSYDRDVFEAIDTTNFTEQENWSDVVFNEKNNSFALINKKGENGNKIVEVKLKVRSDAIPGKTTISVNNASVSDGKTKTTLNETSKEVLVLKDGLESGETIPNNNKEENAEVSKNLETKKETPVVGIIQVIAMLLFAISWCVYYFKLSENDDAKKKIIITIAHLAIILLLLFFTIKTFSSVKNPDANGDGNVDYDDGKDIVEYVLDIKKPENDEEAQDKDLNNDGIVDVTDVALATQNAKETQYNVTVSTPTDYSGSVTGSNVSDVTPGKGDLVTFTFSIDVTPHTDVKSVIIDGKEYDVQKVGDNLYSVTVPAPDKPGLQDVVITGVVLDNGNIVDTYYSVKVDVLKDEPTVDEFVIDSEKEIPEIKVNLKDSDGSLKNAKLVVTDKDGNVVYEANIEANKENVFAVEGLDKDYEYSVKVEATYDLDSDYAGAPEDNRYTKDLVDEKMTIKADYGFIGRNWNITPKVTENDALEITFENEYESYYDVEHVVVGGRKYRAQKDGNTYKIKIDKGSKGTNIAKVEGVILANGSRYDESQNLQYIYLKNAPKILSAQSKLENSNVFVSFEKEDKDGAIVSVTVYLTDENGNVVEKRTLTPEEFEAYFDVRKSGMYKVKIDATYDLGDGEEQTTSFIDNTVLKEPVKVKIVDHEHVEYTNKGEVLDVTYEVETNSAEDVEEIAVNGVILPAQKEAEEGKYIVNFSVPHVPGKLELEVSKIMLKDSGEVDTSYVSTVEILKSVPPKVTGISIVEEEGDSAILAFLLEDSEDTFVSGKIVVTDTVTNTKTEYPITQINENVHELQNILDFRRYNVEILVTYDLDINKEDGLYREEDAVLGTTSFELIGDYNFDFSNYKVKNVDLVNNNIVLEFNASIHEEAQRNYDIEKVMINAEEYNVEKVQDTEDTYTVTVPFTDTNRKELELEEVILTNSQGFAINENNVVTVFKTKPEAIVHSTVTREILYGVHKVSASLSIVDPDNTIIEDTLKAELVAPDGSVIATQVITKDTADIVFTTDDEYRAGDYVIEVKSDYDRVDGETHINEKLGEAKVTVEIYASIDEAHTDKKYYEKNEEISITYTVSSNTDKDVSGIIVNDSILPATKNSDGTYTVKLNAPEKYGMFTLNATRLCYDSEQTSATYTLDVDVLKSVKPIVKDLAINDTELTKPVLSFKIEDIEDTFVSGTIYFTKKDTNEKGSITFDSKEDTTFELKDIEEFKEYNLEIEIKYDLDSNKEDAENSKTEVLATSTFAVIGEYNFKISNFKLVEINNDKKTIKVSFESTNDSSYSIEKAYINATEYSVVKENNTYYVEVPYVNEDRTELSLDGVELSNLKGFDNLGLDTILVFKHAPVASLDATITDTLDAINVTQNITDIDEIVSKVYLTLKTSAGNVVEEKEIDEYTKDISFTNLNNEKYSAGDYKVELSVDYDRVDGRTHEREVIATKDITVRKDVVVTDFNISKDYADKNSTVDITFKLEKNTDVTLKNVEINYVTYSVEDIGENTYKVVANVDDVAGIKKYKLNKLIFGDNEEIEVSAEDEVDVLKNTPPTIDALAIDSTNDVPLITFKSTDVEDTFVSGKIVISRKDNDEDKYEIPIDDINTLSYELKNIEEFVKYKVEIFVTYDFDQDKTDNANRVEDVKLAEEEFELIGEYDFKLEDFKLQSIDRENSEIVLSFVSSNASNDYFVKSVEINNTLYEVQKGENNTYTVRVPYVTEDRVELVLQKAILNNLQEFSVEGQSAVVFKKLEATAVATVTEDLKNIKVNVIFKDEDEVLESAYVVLRNAENVELQRKDITESTTVEFITDKVYDAGEYTATVYATYNAEDGIKHENEQISVAKTEVNTIAQIVEVNAQEYATKSEIVPVTYTINTNTKEALDTIVVNENEYHAEKIEENKYSISIPMPDHAGVVELKTEKLVFGNKKEASVDNTTLVEVLKSVVPVISELQIDDTSVNPIVSFKIQDMEDTFVSGKLTVKNPDTGDTQEITIFSKENTTFSLKNIEKFKEYELTISITYDFDTNETDTKNQGTIEKKQTFEIIGDYNFNIDNLEVQSVDRDTGNVTLTFDSTNSSSKYYIDEVVINGNEYSVVREGNTYTVTLPYNTEERQELVLQSAILTNLKEFTNLDKKVVIFKDIPQMEITPSIEDKMETIKASLNLKDTDGTVLSLEARLINPKDETISTITIDNDAEELEFKSPENIYFKAGIYKIQIVASLDLKDGAIEESKEVVIGENTVQVRTRAQITNAIADKEYVEKGDSVKITYTIESNSEKAPTGIMIDNALYNTTLNDDGTVSIDVVAKSGFYGDYTPKPEVIAYDGESVVLENSAEVTYYILKEKPEIEYTFNENVKEQNIVLNVVNNEDAILSDLKAVLSDKEGTQKLEQALEKGENVLNISTIPNGDYILKVTGTYDLDDTKDSINSYDIGTVFEEKELHIISDYKAKVEIQNVEVERENKNITVTFTSTNEAGLDTLSVVINDKTYEAVKQDNDTYKVTIDYEENDVNTTYTVTSVKVTHDIDLDVNATFETFKPRPTVEILPEVTDNTIISGNITIVDNSNTIKELCARLKDSEGNTVKEITLNDNQTKVDFVDTENGFKAGEYTIEIGSNFELVDGLTHNEKETIGVSNVTVKIVAEIEECTVKEFVEKGEIVEVTYTIKSNTDETLNTITVNGTELQVKKMEDGKYTVEFTAQENYGEQTIKATALRYSESVIVDNTSKTYVLKTAPSVEKYLFNDKYEDEKITFTFKDDDNAMVGKAQAIIKNKESGETTLTHEVTVGDNTIEIENIGNSVYEIEFSGNYDLDDIHNDNNNNHDLSEIFKKTEFKHIESYNLTFSIVNVTVDRNSKSAKLEVESTNVENYPLREVVVNDNRYKVVDEDGKHYVYIPYADETYKSETITSVVLENGVELQVSSNNTYEIFKNAPIVKDLAVTVSGNTVSATFSIEDSANIMQNAKIELVGKDDTVVESKDITKDSTTVTFDSLEKSGDYKVRIVADYDRVDGLTHVGETLKEAGVKLEISATLTNADATKYVEKNSETDVTYTVNDNTDEILSAITVNGTEYTAQKTEEDDKYKITYTSKNEAGVETLKVTSIKYENGDTINLTFESTIEVLKDKPSVSDFKVDITRERPVVTYTMTDADESFVSGKIVAKADGKEDKTFDVTKDKFEYEIELEEYTLYNVSLEVTYDRDSDANSENSATEVLASQEGIEYIKDYKLKLENMTVTDVDRNVTYLATITFTSTNESNYDISFVTVEGTDLEVQKIPDLDNEESNKYSFSYVFGEEKVDQRQEITVTDVKLSNGGTVHLDEPQTVVIFKQKPVVTNVSLSFKDGKIVAKYTLSDPDTTLQGINAVLYDENKQEIAEQRVSGTTEEIEIDVIKAGKYKVAIEGTYEALDGKTHTDEVLATCDDVISIDSSVDIENTLVSEYYPEKSQTITLQYRIVSNIGERPTKLVLNNAEYQLTLVDGTEDEYSLEYEVPAESKPQNLEVTKVYFGDNLSVDIPKDTDCPVIEILKDKPTMDITSTDMVDQNMVSFSIYITDKDNAFKSGEGKFNGTTQTLNAGNNTWTVPVEPDTDYTIEFEVVYDRDYNANDKDGEDQNIDILKETRDFRLVSDYGFNITKIDAFNENGEKVEHFEKNEKIQLRFSYTSKVNFTLEALTLDDTSSDKIGNSECKVNELEDKTDYDYYVELNAKGDAGKQTFEVISAKSASTKVIPKEQFVEGSKNNIDIEVLKTAPTVSEFTATNHENSITVKFKVKDDDKALKDDSVVRLRKIGTDASEDKTQKVTEGENTAVFNDLVPGEKYTVTVENSYARCPNCEEFSHVDTSNETEVEITKKEESAFKIRNLTITKRVPINGDVKITFENSLFSYDDVDKITIDGEEYEVSKNDENKYEVTLEPDKTGVNSIYLENAKIKDKTFNILRHLSYTYEYTMPTADNVSEIIEDEGSGEAKLTYTINDPDKSIRALTAYMKTSSGAVIATKTLDLEGEEPEAMKTFSMSLLKINVYSIELRATCDIGDGKTLEDKSLFTQTKESQPRVSIIGQDIDKEYVHKGEDVTLTFKLNTNVDQEVKKIYVNGNSYNANKYLENGKVVEDVYTVKVQAPNESGVFAQKVDRVQIGSHLIDASYPKNPKYARIKVLKSAPTLTHFIIDEKEDTLTFNMNDKDDALISPNPTFIVKNGEETIHSKEIESGDRTHTLKLDEVQMSEIDKPYDVTVNVTYDLRPDADIKNFLDGIKDVFGKKEEDEELNPGNEELPKAIAEEVPDEEEVEEKYVINEDIFNDSYTLAGDDVQYDLYFEDIGKYYVFSTTASAYIQFDCSTGTDDRVDKAIIDGKEIDFTEQPEFDHRFEDEYTHRYIAEYTADTADKYSITYEKVILENGTAFDIDPEDGTVYCMVTMADPKFEITEFIENVEEETARFTYEYSDKDNKLASPLKFTLMDSQGSEIETQEIENPEETSYVEFNIPYPPTSVYKLVVTGELRNIVGVDGYTTHYTFVNESYTSKINTSILGSKFETLYPKQNSTVEIDYSISSTKVVRIDKEDHSNQDKAVSITALTINGKDYPVQEVENKNEVYKVYYTTGDEPGIEEVNVSAVKFSNGDVEEFHREDKIEVLKDVPTITDFTTQNDVANGEITFKFNVNDPDGVLGSNDIYACIEGNDSKEQLNEGENTVKFKVTPDELQNFEVKATYDLDYSLLETEEKDENSYKDETIFTKHVMLTSDYKINITDLDTVNSADDTTKYFEKSEEVDVYFDLTTRDNALYPEKMTIDGVPYDIKKAERPVKEEVEEPEETLDTETTEENNTYTLTLPGNADDGVVTNHIDSITLNSGNIVPLENQNIEYEVLKDSVKVKNFTHSVKDDSPETINLELDVEDVDGANKSLEIEMKDEYDTKITLSKDTLTVGHNELSFNKENISEKYFVSVYSTYNRSVDDNANENYHTKEKIHYQVVSTTTRYIEMKDIVDIKLYKFDELGHAVRVDGLKEDNLEVLDNCLVEVVMKNIPSFYSKVTKYEVTDDNKLKLVLSYEDAMVYTGDAELKPLEVTLDLLEDQSFEYKGSFKSLLDSIKADPDGEFTLYKDYDLTDCQIGDVRSYLNNFTFKGKLHGNGHKIENARKALFENIEGAEIDNLVFDDVVFTTAESKGTVAVFSKKSKISDVQVQNFTASPNNTAVFVYDLNDGSTLERCSAINITYNTTYLSSNVSCGVVILRNNSKIENCYFQGVISSGWWRNGGVACLADNTSHISKNIVNIRMSAYFSFDDKNYGHGNGGIVSNHYNEEGKSSDTTVNLDHNLSLVEGNNAVAAVYNYKGSSLSSASKKNFQLDTAKTPNTEVEGVLKTISRDEINKEFFKTELELDDKIWNIPEDASATNLPSLYGVSSSFSDNGKQPTNTEVYIPDYERVSGLEGYEEAREIVYNNMYKLMPFYDAKEIIRDGNKIDESNNLYTKMVKYIVPFNKDGKMVTYLTKNDYNTLSKIYVVFEDGTRDTYNIDFDDYYGDVASYVISELNIGYNFNEYVLDPEADIIRELVEEASKYEFNTDLAPLTTGIDEDSRLYVEHFNEYTKNNIEDFVIETLVNMGYTPHFESDVLDYKIRQELLDTGKLKQLLFAYNYFTKWYNLDMQGVNLADLVMYHSDDMFNKDMTFDYLAARLVEGGNSATNATATFYNNQMAKYTKISNLGLYLDYCVNSLTDYKDGMEWFKATWHGGRYYEVKLDGEPGELVEYTLWDHLKRDSKVQTDFLPLMNVPDNCMYAASSPTQAYFGSFRTYVTDPNDKAQMDEFEKKVTKWMDEVKHFYQFAYNFWGEETMNKWTDVNYDERFTLTGKGDQTIYNNPYTTEEPYHKYFTEAIGRWSAMSGGAYANGMEVYWVVIRMFDNFRVGTHETLHNQDSKIFMNGYGRRGDAEDYAAGFLQQYYRDGWVSPNIFDEELQSDNVSQNMRHSSVDTPDALANYYKNYFMANDFLDLVEAKAFFELTAEEQAKVAVQVSYPSLSEENQEQGNSKVAYSPLTVDKIKDLENGKIDSMEDLWDKRIMLRPGTTSYDVRSPGADTDSIFNIHWYQPHADNDRPDGANFKYLAWQMAGERGYYDGLVAYYSGSYVGIKDGTRKPTTDLSALRYIMEDEDITFREYKLNRYEELDKHYNEEGMYIDGQQFYKEYLEALREDVSGDKSRYLNKSTDVKRKYFKEIRQKTDDFKYSPFDKDPNPKVEEVSVENLVEVQETNDNIIQNADEFKSKIEKNPAGSFELMADIDFASEIVDSVVNTEFTGTLEGNNHIISGLKQPLFNSLNGATISNIKITNANISDTETNVGALSRVAINTTINNVIIENSNINGEENVGGLVGNTQKSVLKDVHSKDVKINASLNVGGLIGSIKDETVIEECSSNANINAKNNYAGTFAGEIVNSSITNCYAIGKISNLKSDATIGGFVGISDSSKLENNFSKVEMQTKENSGGFVGEIINTVEVNNNLSLSTLKDEGYKFDGKTKEDKLLSQNVNDKFSNNYEIESSKGNVTSNRNEKFALVITTLKNEDINSEFFKEKLKFSTDIWDLSDVGIGEIPKLKNSDPNENVELFFETDANVLEEKVEIEIPEELTKDEEELSTEENNEKEENEENIIEEKEEENEDITEENDTLEETPKVPDTPIPEAPKEDAPADTPKEEDSFVVVPEIYGIS